jgi:hypothetical protein
MERRKDDNRKLRRGSSFDFELIESYLFLSIFLSIIFLALFLSFPAKLSADQGYLNFSFWNRSRVYSLAGPSYVNEYENIFHLDLYQSTINYGNFSGWFDGRLTGGEFDAARWYFSWQGFKAGNLSLNLRLGDRDFQFTNLGYRFTNYFPVYNYLRGVTAGFQYKSFGLDFFTGRVARLSGLLGTVYSLTEQTATGFLGRFEPTSKYYFGFGLVHTENEKTWTGEVLTRTNDILLLESELRVNGSFKLVTETLASFSAGENELTRTPGYSIRFGPFLNRNRWSAEINYRRVDADFKNLTSEFAYDRDQEGVFVSWRYQPKRTLYLFGSADYYHDNVDRLSSLNTTDFWRVYSGFSLISVPWPDLTFRLDFNAAESRRQDESYRHYLSPGFYLQLSKYLGKFYPYLRVRFQHYDDRVNDERDFTYPSIYLGFRYNYLKNAYLQIEAENTRYYDYLQNRVSSQNRLRLSHYSPVFFGADFYGELCYSDFRSEYSTAWSTRRLELFLGLGRQLPWRVKVRLDFRAGWPLESEQPANYWLTLKVDRRFNWGEAPTFQGRAYGPVLTGAGKIEGLIFLDGNLNGILDDGERGLGQVNFQLEDGSAVASDASGKFSFSRVPEGLQSVSLDFRRIPANYYLLAPEKQTLVVERRKTSRVEFVLIEAANVYGKVFQDSNKNNVLDDEDQPQKNVLVLLRPVSEEGLSPALEKMRTEELNTYSDEKGNFVFENILPGSYELMVDEETLPKGAKLVTELPMKIELKPGQVMKDIKIMFLPRPVIYTVKGRPEYK